MCRRGRKEECMTKSYTTLLYQLEDTPQAQAIVNKFWTYASHASLCLGTLDSAEWSTSSPKEVDHAQTR